MKEIKVDHDGIETYLKTETEDIIINGEQKQISYLYYFSKLAVLHYILLVILWVLDKRYDWSPVKRAKPKKTE